MKRLITYLVGAMGIFLLLRLNSDAALSNVPTYAVTPNRGVVQFIGGTDNAGTYKTLYTAATNGSRCNGMWTTNNDPTATHLITLQVVNTAVKYGGEAVTSVLSAGFATGVPAQALMLSTLWPGLPLDSDGNPYLQMITGDTLQATFATAITGTDVLNVYVSCADF